MHSVTFILCYHGTTYQVLSGVRLFFIKFYRIKKCSFKNRWLGDDYIINLKICILEEKSYSSSLSITDRIINDINLSHTGKYEHRLTNVKTVWLSWALLFLSVGHCPVYNTVANKMDSSVCSRDPCPKVTYTSDAVYKCIYH